jgi:DNA-binding beta-propeller fold protein YncE
LAIGMIRNSFGRNSSSSSRVAGPLLVCVMALGLGASIGHGQPVPDTILLPDSLGPLRPPYHLAFGSSTDNIYVASETSDIMVIDGNTFQRIKRINTGTPVGGALLVSQHNRLYCSYPQQARIGVIDCATNSIIGSIQVGTRPTLLCYSPGSDKLYCGDTIDRTVSVIDCAADTVRKVISVGKGLAAMAYDATTNKVYAATQDAVLAISCSSDSIVANISAVKSSRGLCINKRRQKLYVVGPEWTYPDTVYVISTGSDSLAAKIPVPADQFPRLACNEATDRLYDAVDFGAVCEIDCVGDTVTDYCYLGELEPRGLVCDTLCNRLYYLSADGDRGNLIELVCATMEVSSVTPVHPYPAVLESDPARYRLMYAGGRWECVLTVFDYKGDSLYARGGVPLCGWKGHLCRNGVEGKLYFRWGTYHGGMGIIEEGSGRVVTLLSLPQAYGDQLTCSGTSNKVYLPVGKGLGVIDGLSDSLLRVIEMGDGIVPDPCWCPDENKVYCYAVAGARKYIAAVDCCTDSVVWEMDVYDRVYGMQYLGNHRLLCWEYDRLILLDCRSDSILVDTVVGANLYAFAHTGDGEKVYIAHGIRLEVLDASSLSLLATVDWTWASTRGSNPFLMCSDSIGKIYWFVRDMALLESDSVLAIDTRGDTAVSRLGVGHMQLQGCLDHSGRYIFNPNPPNGFRPFPDSNSLIVYDTQSDSVAAVYESLPKGAGSVTPNQEQRRIYVGCQDVILVYSDSPPGVSEQATSALPKLPLQTVVRGVLCLAEGSSSSPSTSYLLDAAGRKLMDLKSGANDVRPLAPGVYFVREEPQAASSRPQAVRKVVITR